LALTAIPVFLHRGFRHRFIFRNTTAGIEALEDLTGKKVSGYVSVEILIRTGTCGSRVELVLCQWKQTRRDRLEQPRYH
jgi:hypothetical protein